MSKGQTLRALVTERLSAAAEDIFVLFETTIVEYEEELRWSKEENRRKQQLLDKVMSPRVEIVRGNFQIPSTSPGPNQEIPETPQIKEEQSVKQEDEQLPVIVPESSAVCAKTEDSSELPQSQTEDQEETQRENISSEPHFHTETEGHTEHSSDTDNHDAWDPPFGCSAAQMDTEAHGGHYNQVQFSDRGTELSTQNTSAPETTVLSHMSGADEGAERKKHQCNVCNKRFHTNHAVQTHIRVHTKEKPYSCSICYKSFSTNSSLIRHTRIHTGEKPYHCTVCVKSFSDQSSLAVHRKRHTGERPFSCPMCEKQFLIKGNLEEHKRRHTGDKPFGCSFCDKRFVTKQSLTEHERRHTGEKPYRCSVCTKSCASIGALKYHTATHTGDKPHGSRKRTSARRGRSR